MHFKITFTWENESRSQEWYDENEMQGELNLIAEVIEHIKPGESFTIERIS
jgi:hypothetical protein